MTGGSSGPLSYEYSNEKVYYGISNLYGCEYQRIVLTV